MILLAFEINEYLTPINCDNREYIAMYQTRWHNAVT